MTGDQAGKNWDRSVKQVVALANRLKAVLGKGIPSSSPRLATSIAIDFADLWEVGQKHNDLIGEMLKLSLPADRQKLEDILIEMEVNWAAEGLNHAKSLKKRIPFALRRFRELTRHRPKSKSHRLIQADPCDLAGS